MLFGTTRFWIPGLGLITVGGPIVALIVGTLESTALVVGTSALGASLFAIDIPKDSILKYEIALRAGKFLLIAVFTGS